MLRTILLMSFLLTACMASPDVTGRPMPRYAEFEGVYSAGPLAVTEVRARDTYVAVRPPEWGGRPYFAETAENHFTMALPHVDEARWVDFQTDDTGRIVALTFEGLHPGHDGHVFTRLQAGEETPASLFLQRRPQEAAAMALADPDLTVDALHDYTRSMFSRYPSRTSDVLAFLVPVRERFPDHAGLMATEGLARIALGDRAGAHPLLQAAISSEPGQPDVEQALRRLEQAEPGNGEGYRAVLPFSLDAAFALPTEAEIERVRQDWANRDLSPSEIHVVHNYETEISDHQYDVLIIEHDLEGARHFGAAFVPQGSDGTELPVVIDARGVNPAYSPMSVDDGTQLIRALGWTQTRFIVLVPAMNGHTLQADGRTFVSTGDPTDAWDGATDATLSFLYAALQIVPEANAEQVAIFGHSRGGTVALLTGIRDPRIDLALSVAGPVDHFQAQSPTTGWTNAEIQRDAMRDGQPATLGEEGGQDFDHFLHRVVTENESLGDVRHRMIASSPVYFVDSLPETHAFYGADDGSVPVRNAHWLQAGIADSGSEGRSTVTIFPDLSHDTDSLVAWRESVSRLEAWARGD